MNVILQRQWCSHSSRTNFHRLLTPGAGNDATPFYVEIVEHHSYKSVAYLGNITFNEKSSSTEPQETPADCREVLGRMLTKLMGEPVTIAERIELYCPGCRLNGDVEFPRARYEEGTDTIRSVPENYCLIAWQDGQPIFDVDGATEAGFEEKNGISLLCRWRTICAKAHEAYTQPVNKPGTTEGKKWLAWLISEYRKYGHNV